MTEATRTNTDADKPTRRTRATRDKGTTPTAPKQPEGKPTKANAVVALLSRARGATLDEMMATTGWQAHSVRGFLSGTVKKKLGHGVISETGAKGRIYRIVAGDQ